MLILVSPNFSNSNPGDADFRYTINNLENPTEMDDEIKKQLTTLFPGSVVERFQSITNYYTIQSLPDETKETFENWLIPKYFQTLSEYRSEEPVMINVGGSSLRASIYFDIAWEEFVGINYDDDSSIAENAYYLRSEGETFEALRFENFMFNNTTHLGAKFSGSRIKESTFINAKLMVADFTDTEFSSCNFNNADLRYADLSVAEFDNTSILTEANLRYANLSGTNFNGANLSGADLRYAELTEATNFTGCNLTGTKFSGMSWEQTIHPDIDIMNIAVIEAEEDETAPEERENDLVHSAEKENYITKFNAKLPESSKETKILPPLAEIDPTAQITANDTHTYADLVAKLTPVINSKKLPISEMEPYKWYGIASLGTTAVEVWTSNAVEEPTIGKVFKCVLAPPVQAGEAIVYESTPACMAVHELGRMLDLPDLFMTFEAIVGKDKVQDNLDTLQQEVQIYESLSNEAMVEKFTFFLHQLLVFLLGLHNADEAPDAWTHIFDDIDKRKQLVKHAIFNREEGLMYHPWFLTHWTELLAFCMFIEQLPLQMQVKWAQHYILEFITGYGQELETFDPKHRTEMGFIASCINGNMEKLLLSVRTAITHFYQLQLEEESPEQKLQNMKNAVTGSEFQKYYETVEDIEAGPSIEGYITYIRENPEISEELKTHYLAILEDSFIQDQIREIIKVISGGKRQKKQKSAKAKSAKAKSAYNNKSMKKTMKKLIKINKKTLKKNKKSIKTNKKTIKRRKSIKQRKKY
jgi:hypothetical protein